MEDNIIEGMKDEYSMQGQLFKIWRKSIPGTEDKYSRHGGQLFKAGRATTQGM